MALKDWHHALPDGTWESLGPNGNTGLPRYPIVVKPAPRPIPFHFSDEYTRYPDGARSGIAATGQPWGVYGDGITQGGRFDSVGPKASYLEADIGGRVTWLRADWYWDDAGGTLTDSGTLCLVSWADGGIVAQGFNRRTSAHVTITQNAVQFYVRETMPGTNQTVVLLSTQPHPARLAAGQIHRMDVLINHAQHTGTVIVNDQQPLVWVDDRIRGYDDERYACFEPYYEGSMTASRVKLLRTYAMHE